MYDFPLIHHSPEVCIIIFTLIHNLLDRNNIVVHNFVVSSQATTLELHSPLSISLFHRVILESSQLQDHYSYYTT